MLAKIEQLLQEIEGLQAANAEELLSKPKITAQPKWILPVRLIPSNWEHVTR